MKALPSSSIVTQSQKLREILSRIATIAASDSSVLLIGETGVGKELFADFIHHSSYRAQRPLIKISLSAMPHELLESELFGHEKGAFTTAVAEKRGLFELAHTGTLFLDDIDDVSPTIQGKLLRALESHEIMRVGGTTPIPIDVRVITASKVDLKEVVSRGIFRADLFYRINVVPIEIPPLRERAEDIPLLIGHYLQRFSPSRGLTVSPSALRALIHYPWPGNVRELRNITQRLALFATGEIQMEDLPAEIQNGNPFDLLVKTCSRCFVEQSMSLEQVMACLEFNLLRQALRDSSGNRSQAAKLLGLSLSTFRDKLKKYRLNPDFPAMDPQDQGSGIPQVV
jgi:two-component system response regulator AtoC